MMVRIGLAQIDVVLGDKNGNLARVKAAVHSAKEQGADLVVLPELWGTGYDTENWERAGEPIGSGLFAEARALAQSAQVTLVAGSLLERDNGGRLYNTATVWSPTGRLLTTYRKQHLFSPMQEDRYLTPGKSLSWVDLPITDSCHQTIRTGLAICYDLRFPETFRALAIQECSLLIVMAQWPHPRGLHWSRLMQARAIENLAYVAGVNRVGGGKTTQFCGRSCVIDPWGEILVEAGESNETVVLAEIQLERVEEARQILPVLKDAMRY